MNENEREYGIQREYCRLQGEAKYQLILFGDHIAAREGYKIHQGLTAIHFYLVEKYRWLPNVVRSFCDADLELLLAEEMSGWNAPEAAYKVTTGAGGDESLRSFGA